MDRGVLEDTLMKLERQGWDSLCDGTGAEFYGRVMTEDGLMVLANGAVMDRDAVVEALGQAPPWRTYEISDVRL
ncbi:MAG: nuclear transport factor 2 family protein, partial [Geodermatophilaceae bacterium]|nr:nuclear transport factor 2 family protein [Geodermatophilaceae bacterium]